MLSNMECISFKGFGARLQRLIGREPKSKRRSLQPQLQISAPFNFKHETGATLPGVSEDEIAILKEKAAASRLGVQGAGNQTDHSSSTSRRSPRRPAPPSPIRTVTPMLQVTPSTPLTPSDNMI